MYDYDVVYIKGNPNSGSIEQHAQMNESILDLLTPFSHISVESELNNHEFNLPKAKIYIGFSRGSRYLKKLNKDVLKLSIGGVAGRGIKLVLNKDDKILQGDISSSSMHAHFIILDEDKIKIKKLINDFLLTN